MSSKPELSSQKVIKRFDIIADHCKKKARKWGGSIKDEPRLHIGEGAYFIDNKRKKIKLWSKND